MKRIGLESKRAACERWWCWISMPMDVKMGPKKPIIILNELMADTNLKYDNGMSQMCKRARSETESEESNASGVVWCGSCAPILNDLF